MSIELVSADLLIVIIAILGWMTIGSVLLEKKNITELRRVPAIDACLEAVRICAEKGAPLYFSPGDIGISFSTRGVQAWVPAIMQVLKTCATTAGQLGVSIFTCTSNPQTTMMVADYLQQGYLEGGRPELFNQDEVYFFPSYIARCMGAQTLIEKKKPGAGIMLGGHWWATQFPGEELLAKQGAFIVAGDSYTDDNFVSALVADYIIFQEEAYAAGIYLSEDKVQAASLISEDPVKIILIAVTVIAGILYTAGVI